MKKAPKTINIIPIILFLEIDSFKIMIPRIEAWTVAISLSGATKETDDNLYAYKIIG
jgi:hypothetical protein